MVTMITGRKEFLPSYSNSTARECGKVRVVVGLPQIEWLGPERHRAIWSTQIILSIGAIWGIKSIILIDRDDWIQRLSVGR